MENNEIQILGLESDAYYFLNPIYLTIKSDNKFITYADLKLTNKSAVNSKGEDLQSANFRLQSNPEGIIYVDISEYIKSLAVYPNGYRAKNFDYDIPSSLNNITLDINVYNSSEEIVTNFNFDKQFIRGYVLTPNTNVVFSDLNLIYDINNDEEINVPYYRYPDDYTRELSLLRYHIVDGVIDDYNIQESQIEIQNHINLKSCKPIIVRFLNSKGGFNFIVFSNYSYTTQSNVDDSNKIKVDRYQYNQVSYIDQKVTHSKEFTAVQEYDERFAGFADELIRSQCVWVAFGNSDNFVEVDMQNNSMPSVVGNSFELSYKFKVSTSINL